MLALYSWLAIIGCHFNHVCLTPTGSFGFLVPDPDSFQMFCLSFYSTTQWSLQKCASCPTILGLFIKERDFQQQYLDG